MFSTICSRSPHIYRRYLDRASQGFLSTSSFFDSSKSRPSLMVFWCHSWRSRLFLISLSSVDPSCSHLVFPVIYLILCLASGLSWQVSPLFYPPGLLLQTILPSSSRYYLAVSS